MPTRSIDLMFFLSSGSQTEEVVVAGHFAAGFDRESEDEFGAQFEFGLGREWMAAGRLARIKMPLRRFMERRRHVPRDYNFLGLEPDDKKKTSSRSIASASAGST